MEKYNNHFKKLNRQNNRNDPAEQRREHILKKKTKKIEHQGLLYTPGTAESIQKTLNLCDRREEKKGRAEKGLKEISIFCPRLAKDINPEIQETEQNPDRKNEKNFI